MINGHGDDIYKYKDQIAINFSSNIYAKQDMLALHTFLCLQLRKVHSYPEPDASSLNALLAEKHQIKVENIQVTNGATEAIYLLAQTYQNSRSAIIIPTFSEYEDACRINRHQLRYYKDLNQIEDNIDIVWLCNPNNPDGRIYDVDYLIQVIEDHPNILFVIDQSYASFSNLPVLSVQKTIAYKNVILLHSMTKQYAIPGLRLGYITAHSSVIEKVNIYRMPWSVNTLAIEGGKYLIDNDSEQINIEEYLSESKRLQCKLANIQGLEVVPSPTHYFLCRLKDKKASDLKQWLIEKYGILIRDASNFRGLNEHYFRIATQSPDENEQLIKALKGWI
ncbi:threonine-phosphate decarboxylase [Dysgonomonas sp. Marseille-P4361]|uniref:threonine-phosphate decarboxylase n=1 Tax=Dysgonomonas sp. Marseille-P4361 TaxID=2161820 RepID=UPI000D551D55|nr:threonine-phosphate decarboxylase [Dysgonomonas sp. Marseille-P4361]